MNDRDLANLFLIVVTADALEEYLHKNTGDNADWDVSITANGKECADKLAGLMTDLSMALKPYRAKKIHLDNFRSGVDSSHT